MGSVLKTKTLQQNMFSRLNYTRETPIVSLVFVGWESVLKVWLSLKLVMNKCNM